jgi:hypothetical protein
LRCVRAATYAGWAPVRFAHERMSTRELVDYFILDSVANDFEALEEVLRILNADAQDSATLRGRRT